MNQVLPNSILTCETFDLTDLPSFKAKALAWANHFQVLCFLDNNQYNAYTYHSYEALLAVGEKRTITPEKTAFEALQTFIEAEKSWVFGFLTYDLKNEVEKLESNHPDGVALPQMHFFEPTILIEIHPSKQATIHAEHPFEIFKIIQNTPEPATKAISATPIELQPRIPKSVYVETVEAIRDHIIEGDVYEMNFCQEFFAENAPLNPLAAFQRLNRLAKAPFSAFYKLHDRYLLSSSPERFLKKEGQKIISQPIKGTTKRSPNPDEDKVLRDALFRDEKNRAENVMIVDLVRNDLARSCQTGTVEVEELFGVYTFEQVHQLVSTVSGTIRPELHPVAALRNAFPMGSMTGAPKVMSMELIEQYEKTKRGLYSGAVGYFKPNGDFDFNVVIRSILYNALTAYVSVQVGGAIVYDSDPLQEYEECLLKAQALRKILRGKA